jgi:hypothetical protein
MIVFMFRLYWNTSIFRIKVTKVLRIYIKVSEELTAPIFRVNDGIIRSNKNSDIRILESSSHNKLIRLRWYNASLYWRQGNYSNISSTFISLSKYYAFTSSALSVFSSILLLKEYWQR